MASAIGVYSGYAVHRDAGVHARHCRTPDEEGHRSLQLALLHRPESGALIPRSGGLRKLRWPLPGRGKWGGLRIIYFWDGPSETFYMFYAYPKNEQEDLTGKQLQILSRLVREEFG